LNQAEYQTVTRHLVVCSCCAQDYRLLYALQPLAEQLAAPSSKSADEEKVVAGHIGWLTRIQAFWQQLVWTPQWRAAALVATVVVVAGVSLTLWRAPHPGGMPTPGERGGRFETMQVEPPHRAALPAPPERLAWSPVESVEGYHVILQDSELTPIWESPRVAATSVVLPETVRHGLQPGRAYYWRVIIHEAIDQRQSNLFQFTLSANPRE
jgi:hypothetical protein